MKSILKLVVKGVLVIVLFAGTSIALSSAGVKSVNEAKAAVSYQVVYQYLVSRGYEVISLKPINGSKDSDWIAHTVKNQVHYWTTVDVSGNSIIGTTDIIM